jgi:hypothetical protein
VWIALTFEVSLRVVIVGTNHLCVKEVGVSLHDSLVTRQIGQSARSWVWPDSTHKYSPQQSEQGGISSKKLTTL